jgi:hypothetical protein
MGFSGIPPRADLFQAIAAIDMWSQRADQAIMHHEPPWDSLLAGVLPETLITRENLALAQYYRAKGHFFVVLIDPNNGLNRSSDSDALVRAGRSMTEPAIQQMFRRYVVVADSMLQPDILGTIAETNLIRVAAPPALYAAMRQVANDAAADVRARNPAVALLASVQVETAWGRLPPGPYQGVEQDFLDFPFINVLGLSSYPYLAGWAEPENLPLDYYSRLVAGRSIPVIVTEGGWSSATLDTIVSSPVEQARYLRRQMALLDAANALGVFQLTFTDLDLSGVPLPPGSILPLFATCGLVDADLVPKPALAVWDSVEALPRH